ncbi:PQ loop repeat-domain-containing protein [Apiosordaria backusii]|uniref:PQ loop repeat-domain-containing protein n=1 Tax=Apiosordaria backusii TaxID=314023 RepID=A0AA40ANC9_9PEZI|nr:PQ loop repeat-domain-containing protein [Apiosordaria backusii]
MASLIMSLPSILQAPTAGEALSGIFGSVSLTAWICLLLPQLITNYKSKSADALSMKFLLIWLLGDISNLSGAFWTSLAPSSIALGAYFCVADLILITQCSYYNTINARRRAREQHHHHHHHHHHRRHSHRRPSADSDTTAVEDTPANEESPLLNEPRRPRSDSQTLLPGSHRRHSTHRRRSSNLDPLTRIITGEDDTPDSNPWLHNTLSILAVWIVGGAGWFISYRMGAWDSPDLPSGSEPISAEPQAMIGMVLGYISAVCYLCARIPQIIKNYQEKSCEGLALLFFLLSLTGNFTYGASVMSYSQDKDYLLRALPWLLGSFGTIVEDGIIFVQFRIYSKANQAGGQNKVVGNSA